MPLNINIVYNLLVMSLENLHEVLLTHTMEREKQLWLSSGFHTRSASCMCFPTKEINIIMFLETG
ncbi:rCG37626, partial [Rattus norvegicus]